MEPWESPDSGYSLEEALAAMDALHPGAYMRCSWQKLRHLFSKALCGHPIPYFDDTPSRPMIRGREIRVADPLVGLVGSGKKPLICQVSELGPLPIEKCQSFGRCHAPGSPMFYGAFNESTVLSELRPALESIVYLLTCIPKPGEKFKSALIGEIDHVRRYDRGSVFTNKNEHIEQLRKWIPSASSENDYVRLVTDAFMADMFLQHSYTEDNFRATSALASLVLNLESVKNSGTAEALYYPSVAHRGGMNIALTRKCFEEKVQPLSCKAVLVQRNYGYGIYKWQTLAESSSIGADGTISWRSLDDKQGL